MKRITLVLGLVAVMAAMMAALAAPAMAKDNNGHKNDGDNRLDNQLDRLDNRLNNRLDRLDDRFDLDDGILVGDVDLSSVYVTNDEVADELCSPLNSDAINNAIPGCIFGDDESLYLGYPYLWYNPYLSYEVDYDFDTVGIRNDVFDNDFDNDNDIDFDRHVDVDFDRNIGFDNGKGNNHNGKGNNHNGNGKGNNHNGGGGKKGNGK